MADMGSLPAYKALAIVVLGGLGNIPGTVLASIVVGLAETSLHRRLAIPFREMPVGFCGYDF